MVKCKNCDIWYGWAQQNAQFAFEIGERALFKIRKREIPHDYELIEVDIVHREVTIASRPQLPEHLKIIHVYKVRLVDTTLSNVESAKVIEQHCITENELLRMGD